MKKLFCIFSITGVMLVNMAFAQSDDQQRMYLAPDAASLLKNYQITNDLFNGRVNISVPVYEIKTSEISVPVSVSYSGGGIKPDEDPSIVGIGWSLNFGGTINRITKGQPDEFVPLQTETDIVSGVGTIINTYPSSVDQSYFANYSKLNTSSWSSTSFLNTLNTNSPYFTSLGPSTEVQNANPLIDLEPDEFQFNFNGISGRFALDYTGKWQVVTDEPGMSFEVVPYVGTDVHKSTTTTSSFEMRRAITQFTLIGSDGTQYVFGDTNSTDPINIDYNIQGFWGASFNYKGPWTPFEPIAWHLTKIISKLGNEIDFFYKRSDQVSQTRNYSHVYGSSLAYDYNSMDQTLYETWVPDYVITSENIRVQFVSSLSNQLPLSAITSGSPMYFTDINTATGPVPVGSSLTNFPKLTEIDISQNGNLLKKFSFSYIENATERLKLQSISENDINGNVSAVFSFAYNPLKLPVYASGMTDHWGYFNNVNFFQTTPPPYTYDQLNTTYTQSRNPNFSYSPAEILQSMTLPTGGTIEFTYEPVTYSKTAGTWPFTATDNNANLTAGGARIQKMTKKINGNIVNETDYLYQRSDNASLSSGILAIPPNHYVAYEGTSTTNFDFFAAGLNPFNNRGAHVVYGRVIEKTTGNGYTVYSYESYDTHDGNDAAALTELPATQTPYPDCFNNGRFKRGKTKDMSVYNEAGGLLKETVYTYSHNNAATPFRLRSIHFLPAIRYSDNTFRATAYETDFFSDMVTSVVTTEHSSAGTFTSSEVSTYDQYNNIIERDIVSSKNELVSDYTKYPFNTDYDGSANAVDINSLGIQLLRSKKIKNVPIETYEVRGTNANPPANQEVTKASLITYYSDKPLVREHYELETAVPISLGNYTTSVISSGNLVFNSNLKRKVSYLNYDSYGNILSFKEEYGVNKSAQIGFKLYPVASVVNAQNVSAVYAPLAQTGFVPLNPGVTGTQTKPFTTFYTGTIVLSIPNGSWLGGAPPATCTVGYTLSGPGGIFLQGSLCNSGNGSCTNPRTISFNSMPPGNYSLAITVYAGNNTSASVVSVEYDYTGQQLQTAASKEFFYEGFEEAAGTATATPFAGSAYNSGSYTVPFTMPNARNYIIEYHYLQNGIWYPKSQVYQNNMVLSDGTAIDEVRVYPSDAQMTTYTFSPLVGMTAKLDVGNRGTFYEYDKFGRLNIIRDLNKNILKKFCYNYAGQQTNCDGFLYYNDIEQGTFTRNNCPSGYTPGTYTTTVPANTYGPYMNIGDANQQAINYINANGQNNANTYGSCTAPPPPPPNINVTYTNSTSYTAHLQLTNTSTGTVYPSATTYFTLNGNTTSSTTLSPQIPQGTYNAYIYSDGAGPYTFRIYTFVQSGVNSTHATNLSLCATCASVSVQ